RFPRICRSSHHPRWSVLTGEELQGLIAKGAIPVGCSHGIAVEREAERDGGLSEADERGFGRHVVAIPSGLDGRLKALLTQAFDGLEFHGSGHASKDT